MNVQTTMELIDAIKELPITIFCWGHTGEAKSSLVDQLTTRLNRELVDVRVGLMADPADIEGFPRPVAKGMSGRDKDGKPLATFEDYVMRFIPPEWFPRKPPKGKDGWVLFLDEANRVSPDILQALFQLIYDRRIGANKLYPNTILVCAGNYCDSRDYMTTSFSDAALWTRFLHVNVQIDHAEWLTYMLTKADNPDTRPVDRDVIEFVGHDTNVFRTTYTDVKLAEGHFNPRTWDRLAEVMAHIKRVKPELWVEHDIEIASGLIGATTASSFVNWARDKRARPLSGGEVLYEYPQHRRHLQNILGVQDSNLTRMDSVHATITNVMYEINKIWDSAGEREPKLPPDTDISTIVRNISAFVKDLRNDMRTNFYLDLYRHQAARDGRFTFFSHCRREMSRKKDDKPIWDAFAQATTDTFRNEMKSRQDLKGLASV